MTTENKQRFQSSLVLYVVFSILLIIGIPYVCLGALIPYIPRLPTFILILACWFLFRFWFSISSGLLLIGVGATLAQKEWGYLSYEECLKRAKEHGRREFKKELTDDNSSSGGRTNLFYFFFPFPLFPFPGEENPDSALYKRYKGRKSNENPDLERGDETQEWADCFFIYCAWIINKKSRVGFPLFSLACLLTLIPSIMGVEIGPLPLLICYAIFLFGGYKILRGGFEVV